MNKTPEQVEINRQAQLKWNVERREAGIPHHNSLASYRMSGIEDQHPSRHMTDIHKNNVSKSMKVICNTPEHKARVSATNTGRKHTLESRRKMAVSKYGNDNGKGYKHTDEYCEEVAVRQEGVGNSNWVPMNILDARTRRIIAHNICLSKWCRDNGINRVSMWETANGLRGEYNGYKAEYIL